MGVCGGGGRGSRKGVGTQDGSKKHGALGAVAKWVLTTGQGRL